MSLEEPNDQITSQFNDGDESFVKSYEDSIKDEINELAELLSNSFNDQQISTIEEKTDVLFSDIEKLDSENLIVLHGYKVLSRSYFLLKQYRKCIDKNHQQQTKTESKQKSDITSEEQARIFQKQNEALLSKLTEHIEKRESITDNSDTAKIQKEFDDYKSHVEEIIESIKESLDHREDINDLNELNIAIKACINEKNKQIHDLVNDFSSNDSKNYSEEVLQLENKIKTLEKNNSQLVSQNKSLKAELEKSQSEKNQSEKNQSEKNQSEKNQSEKNQSEKNQSEKNQSEKNQSEKNQSEKNQSEKNQSEKNQSEKNQSEKNQSEKNQLEKNHLHESRNPSKNKDKTISSTELQNNVKEIKEKYKEAQKRINAYDNQISDLKKDVLRKDEIIRDLKKERDIFRSISMKNTNTNNISVFDPAPKPFEDPFILKTELESLKLKYHEVERKNDKLKTKVKKFNQLEKSLNSLQSQLKRDEEKKKLELTKLQLENDDLKAKIEGPNSCESLKAEISAKSTEIQTLSATIDKLSAQLSEQCNEISNENSAKSSLLSIVEKQSSALCEYERIVMEKCTLLSKHESEISRLNLVTNNEKQKRKTLEKQFEDLFDDLISYAKNYISDDCSDEIVFTLNNHRPQDIIASFQILSHQLDLQRPKSQAANNQTAVSEKVYNYMFDLLKILRALVSEDDCKEDQKAEIIQECLKADAFIQENAPGLAEEPTIFDAFGLSVDESYFIEKVTKFINDNEDLDALKSNELFCVLTYAIIMNSMLRKAAISFRDQCEIRTFELKKLKEEFRLQKQTYESQNLDHILPEKNNNKTEKDNLQNQHQKTDNTHDNSLNQTEDKPIEQNDSEILPKNNEENANIREKYENLKVAYREAKKQYNSEVSKMKKKVKIFIKQNNDLRKRIETHNSIIDEMTNASEKSQSALSSLQNEINSREAELEASTTIIKKQREEIDVLKETIDNLNEQLLIEMNREKNKGYSEEYINKLKTEFQKEIAKLNKQNKIQETKIAEELEYEKSRNENLKSQYESILHGLREKLNEARISETKARIEFNSKDTEIKDLKAKIKAINVENKVVKMKVASLEEKACRERSLSMNQSKAQQIAFEQQITSKMNEYEAKVSQKDQIFLSKILEMLHEYSENDAPITRESVKMAVRFALEDISRLRNALSDTKVIANEISRVRSILKPNRTQSTADVVQRLVNQRDDLLEAVSKVQSKPLIEPQTQQLQPQLQNLQNNLKAWETWARRLFTLATESTSVAKSDKELRNAIEEMVIGSFSIGSNNWVIESLRKQKRILLSRVPLSPKKKKPSILTILMVYGATRRMQKMSGHLHSELVPSIPQDENDQTNKKVKFSPKKYPLIQSYD